MTTVDTFMKEMTTDMVLHTTTVAEQSERELLRAWAKQLEAGAT